MGAWIEIYTHSVSVLNLTSLPLWERGLKWELPWERIVAMLVAPLVGAWIEIAISSRCLDNRTVAPLVGAWIEMLHNE